MWVGYAVAAVPATVLQEGRCAVGFCFGQIGREEILIADTHQALAEFVVRLIFRPSSDNLHRRPRDCYFILCVIFFGELI